MSPWLMYLNKLKRKESLLVFLVVIISILGIVAIGSASHIYNTNGISNEFSGQKIWFATGLILMIIFSFIDYEMICKFYIPVYILNLILLVAVIVIGKNNSDSVTRWISLGPVNIQPSEFSKLFMIIFLSNFVNNVREKINKFYILAAILILALFPVFLIMKQPSLSASMVVVAITFTVLFCGGLDYKFIRRTIFISVPILTLLFLDLMSTKHFIVDKFLKDYQINRITSIMKADDYSENFYQTKQSMYAIGSGQIFGKGLYNGTINRLNYLPESHNDFIFSVIGEEFGFVGCAVILCLMLWIIIICLDIASNSNSFLAKLIICGIAGMFAFQTFVNTGVATGILPNTGMPFPFVSYGGSSMLVNMICIGIIINIGLNTNKKMFR